MTIDEVVFFANHRFGETAYLIEDNNEFLLFTAQSKWRILKKDFSRFHKYILYHSNNTTMEGFHRQKDGVSLDFLIFDAIRHDNNAMNGISWEEFHRLWGMYLLGREVESRAATFNFLCE